MLVDLLYENTLVKLIPRGQFHQQLPDFCAEILQLAFRGEWLFASNEKIWWTIEQANNRG
jgi:hypothetical protein